MVVRQLNKFKQRILAAFGLALAVVVLLSGITWKVAADATESVHRVAHSQEVLHKLARIRADTLQIEITTQNFRISGNEKHLAERDTAIVEREGLLRQLRTLILDNPQQQTHWEQLQEVINQRLGMARQVEFLRKTQGAEAANAFVASAPLQETRARIRQVLSNMDEQERQLLGLRTTDQSKARYRMLLIAALASTALFALLVGTYFLVRRQVNETYASRQALAESEEDLSITLRSIGDAVIATDIERRITRMNAAAEQMTGWPFAEAQGRSLDEVFRLADEPGEPPLANEAPGSGQPGGQANHAALLARDGTVLPIADSAAPIRGAAGDVRGSVIVFHDESAAREAQRTIREQNMLLEQRVRERTRQLHESEGHLREVINNVPALIAFVDTEQRYVYVNRQYRECFALSRPDIAGCTVREILGDERYAIAAPLIAKVLRGEPQSYDWEPFPGVWQVINYAPKYDDQGLIVGYYVLGTDITGRRRAESALRDSEQRLARVLEGADQGYWDWNLKTDEFSVSGRWETMLGYQPGEMDVSTGNWPALVHPDDFPSAIASIERHLSGQSDRHEAEIRCLTKQGDWLWVLTRGSVVERAGDGTPLIMSGTHTDIAERKKFELAQLEASSVFEHCYEAIMVTNADGQIAKVNPAFTRITGYGGDEVIGKSPGVLASGRHDESFFRDFWAALQQHDFWQGEIWNRRKSGELFVALQSVSVARDHQGRIQHYISVFSDISQLKAHEVELDRAANYDSLTALPNRRLLSDRLRQSLARSMRSGKLSAICFMDLDGFKTINDRYGHAAGDQLLLGVSEHLKQVLRVDDTLARLGGDEFVVLFSDIASPEECTQVLDRLLLAVRKPVNVEGYRLLISASIGVSLYPADDADPDTLLRHADQAMYLAKLAGKDRYQLFDPENDRIAQRHRAHLDRLRQGVLRDEFLLFYQPKVDLVSGEVIGAEALARWQHPERGLLSPGEFLPDLHGSDLECAFGEWVIEAALRQIKSWMAMDLQITVSVNISANHLLQPNFVDRLGCALARHACVSPAMLELEILETAALSDLDKAVQILERCMALGVRFSLDDFGTGYSSLTYLRKLPINTLKIDQSFVRDMLDSPDDLGIVHSVIQLASAFHHEVIAEGVETMAHGSALRKMGCRLAQGYGIAKPMPAGLMPSWCGSWAEAEAWKTI
ncbi:EAL domain-containing protein [uncultured Dechloromonas sp.]|uniref:EAL domain-containing protein n=1 Tax=uncultured Dechloromonas sp. TaxID=171719 RepID=UPI0025CFBC7E|nr:EAL domain-containing protein [uncultured Dechloromonas sp.]